MGGRHPNGGRALIARLWFVAPGGAEGSRQRAPLDTTDLCAPL